MQHTLRLIATDRVDGFSGAQDASAWLLAKRDAALVQRSGAYFGLPWCATTAVVCVCCCRGLAAQRDLHGVQYVVYAQCIVF